MIPLPKLRELGEAVRAIFTGPFTTKFPKAVDSVHPNYRGILKFDPDNCICCGACVRVCPTNAREIIVDREKGVVRNIHHADRCILCGQCTLYCTTRKGVRHTPEFDLARTERAEDWHTQVEQELAYCEDCGEPFASKAHLLWIANRVGDLVSVNPTLALTRYNHLGLAAPDSAVPRPDPRPPIPDPRTPGPSGLPYRSGTMRILCPECRRRVYIAEQWGY